MRKLLTIALLTACNPVPGIICEYSYEAAGMTVCSEGEMSPGAPAQLEEIVSIVRQELWGYYPHVGDIGAVLKGYEPLVVVGRVFFVSSCHEIPNSGFYVCRASHEALVELDRNIIFVKYQNNGCFEPYIAHEILHMIDRHADHKTPHLFGDKTGTSVEEKTRLRILRETIPGCEAANQP